MYSTTSVTEISKSQRHTALHLAQPCYLSFQIPSKRQRQCASANPSRLLNNNYSLLRIKDKSANSARTITVKIRIQLEDCLSTHHYQGIGTNLLITCKRQVRFLYTKFKFLDKFIYFVFFYLGLYLVYR